MTFMGIASEALHVYLENLPEGRCNPSLPTRLPERQKMTRSRSKNIVVAAQFESLC